ncbi:hypothetical protein ISS05_03360 [Candidatus Woesearchaeota archaeon]|nr:hypothetical protein [Candidatus Woesearchaeota archaeon]
MNSKKAQGMSVNVIIIAAIALIVLVVLVAVFTGRFGLFGQGVKGATNCDQACKALGHEEGRQSAGCDDEKKLPGFVSEDKVNTFCCCYP